MPNDTRGAKTQGPHSHIFLTGGEGLMDFFGSEILAKREFFGSMKTGNFLVC